MPEGINMSSIQLDYLVSSPSVHFQRELSAKRIAVGDS